MNYTLTRSASGNIRAIVDSIRPFDRDAALRIRADMMRACETLGNSPMLGHTRTDLTPQDLRFWPVRHWLVVHRRRDPVEIVAVLDARRDLVNLLR